MSIAMPKLRGRTLTKSDDQVDALVRRMSRTDLLGVIHSDPTSAERAVDLMFVCHNLERIADRTTNIAERVRCSWSRAMWLS